MGTYTLEEVTSPADSGYSLNDVRPPITEPLKIGKDAFPDTLRQVLGETDWGTRNVAGAGTSLSNLWEGIKQFAGQEDQNRITANKIIRKEAPVGAIAGDVALTALPFGMAGNSVKAAGVVGGGYGLTQPIEGAQTAWDVIKGKGINAAIGAPTAALGQWGANKLLGSVKGKLSSIEQKVQEKAAQVAESETASARSAAGNAAQNAYRQLEHLRELGSNRALSTQEQVLVKQLEDELWGKAADKLIPAATLKQSTSDAYKDAMATEAQRAEQYAAEKLSGNEAKQQLLARIKRYGPAVVGGALGHMMLPGVGTMGGIAGGLYLRPALRSMINLGKNPAVQHGLLSPLQDSFMLTGSALPMTSLLAAEGLLGK